MAKESAIDGYLATFSYVESTKACNVQLSIKQTGMKVIKHLSEGNDMIVHKMFEPGAIEVFCKGMLKRPWENANTRIVIAPNHFYVSKIITIMKALSQEYSVEVELCRTMEHLDLNSDRVRRVAIMPFRLHDMRMNKIKIYPCVDMVVFYWGNELLRYASIIEGKKYDYFEGMVRILKKHEKGVQVAIFSERGLLLLEEFKKLLCHPEVVSSNKEINTLDGIGNHQFIIVNEELDKVDSVSKIIVDKKLSGDVGNTIIYVDFLSVYDSLVKRLEKYDISTTNAGMSKEEIDSRLKEFLERTHVLITPRIWAREMLCFIDDKVDAIINYSIVKTREYFLRMHLFKNARTAVTLVSEAEFKTELDVLVDIQSRYHCVFKRLFMPCLLGEPKACHFLSEQVRRPPTLIKPMVVHYVCIAKKNIKKLDMIDDHLSHLLKITGISVIFVNNLGSLKRVSLLLNGDNKFDVTCLIPGNLATRVTKGEKPLVFVCGCGTKEFLEILNDCGISRKDVHLLINVDFPSSTNEYRDRIKCCDIDGAVINLGKDADLVDFLDMQVELSVRFADFDYAHVHLKETYKCEDTEYYF